jgi:2',3'-cyclic-nucleotide 2'-phosphodiesterase (5'-nucleotidase family)
LIDSLKADLGEVLLLDGGDYAHHSQSHDERVNWFILRAMGRMGYDAMTLGELELYRGVDYVRSIIDSTQVPITLANGRFSASQAPIGEEFILLEVKGMTVGLIGLIGQDFGEGREKFAELGFDVADPFETAADLVPKVKKKADIVVVLAHMASADAFQLPKAVPGIDVIIFGHYPGTVAPSQVSGAVVVRPGQRGQYLGETRLVLSPENKIVSYSGQAVIIDISIIPEDPEIAAELNALKQAMVSDPEAGRAGGVPASKTAGPGSARAGSSGS